MWVWAPDPLQIQFQLERMDRQKDMQQRVRRERQRSTKVLNVCVPVRVCVCVSQQETQEPLAPQVDSLPLLLLPVLQDCCSSPLLWVHSLKCRVSIFPHPQVTYQIRLAVERAH